MINAPTPQFFVFPPGIEENTEKHSMNESQYVELCFICIAQNSILHPNRMNRTLVSKCAWTFSFIILELLT